MSEFLTGLAFTVIYCLGVVFCFNWRDRRKARRKALAYRVALYALRDYWEGKQ